MIYNIIMFPGPVRVKVKREYFHVVSKFESAVVSTKEGRKYKIVEGSKRQFNVEEENAVYLVCDAKIYNP